MNSSMETDPKSTPHQSIRKTRMPKYEKIITWLWRCVFIGIGAVTLLFLSLIFFGGIPDTETLENPNSNLASEVISTDRELLGRFYRQNRVPVRYDELSPHLITALKSTEDERFEKHAGIDPEALIRVLGRTIIGGDVSGGGGSTISQQLAKLLFPRIDTRRMNKLQRLFHISMTKFKEWITAVKLESRYTKKEIIAMYLNEFNFINGAYGIKSASEIYFSKSQDSLEVQEAALLIGMLKNPAAFNPRRFPERATKRREVVLNQMRKSKHLTKAAYDKLRVLPLGLRFNRTTHNDGLAPYFREELRKEVKKILQKHRKLDGSAYDVHKDGLRIYTTIDSRMQKHAEDAVWTHLTSLQKKFFKHWQKRDPWTYKARGTTDRDIEIRLSAFRRLVRESDRYSRHRQGILKKSQDLKLRDADITRMLKIEAEGQKVARDWLKSGFINKKLKAKYDKVMNSGDWRVVKKEWNTLQETIERDFQSKTNMTVFAYNEAGEKDTLMTPYDSIRYHRMFLQTGVLAVDPTTGYVKAWVGGPNYKYFKFDHANAGVARQVGSTFKPYLYALSIELKGTPPCQKIVDEPVTFEAGTFGLYRSWTPKNAGGGYSGQDYDLKRALKQSKNSISAYLMKDLGHTEPLREFVANMGIDTGRIPKTPAICLGAADLSVFEMTGAYTAFANNGVYTRPNFILRIEDKNGNLIYKTVTEQKEVMSKRTAYSMVQLLKNVVAGTPGVYGVKSEAGGKTGTTNNHADGWFMGITPELVVGTWVGGDDRWVRFRTIGLGQGARMARPIFTDFIKRVEKDERIDYKTKARFERPILEDDKVTFDCSQFDYNDYGDEESEFSEETDSNGTVIAEEFDEFGGE